MDGAAPADAETVAQMRGRCAQLRLRNARLERENESFRQSNEYMDRSLGRVAALLHREMESLAGLKARERQQEAIAALSALPRQQEAMRGDLDSIAVECGGDS
jgi:hypothetical protein